MVDIVELILDEDAVLNGIDAISIVENPAIESDFVALKDQQQEVKFAEVDQDKRILIGAALIPNKPIYRRDDDKEYYVYFSKATIRRAAELFLQKGRQNKTTLEHEAKLEGLSVVESWIVDDPKRDKSALYGLNPVEGTWMVTMKVENEQVWQEYVKTGAVKGFSIEGWFMDRKRKEKEDEEKKKKRNYDIESKLEAVRKIIREDFESYADYGEGIRNNAKRGIALNEKVNNKCATQTGKIRAQQISQGKPLSVSTIKRMYSFLSRAEGNYDPSDTEACGTISYLLWGGKAALGWSRNKLRELGQLDLASQVVDEDFAIIDDRLAYSTQEKAEEMARNIGCEGFHTHDLEGKTWYMPCKYHVKEDMAEVGPRGGIRPSKKAPKSGTPNPNPKGKGTGRGSAKDTRSAKVSKADEATLKKKSDDFNERYKKKLGYGVNVGMLKAVFQRGLGAFNTSHSPRVNNPSQWAFARVNAFLYMVKNGRPQNKKYTGDFDLLPKGHPKKPK